MNIDAEKRVGLQEFLTLLGSLKNSLGWVQEPKGGNLFEFLRIKTNYKSTMPIRQRIDQLAETGYVEIDKSGNRIWRIKVIKEKLEPEKEPEFKHLRVEGSYVNPPPVPLKRKPRSPRVKKRKFIVFIDWKNIYDGLRKNYGNDIREFRKKMSNLGWMLEPITSQGQIIWAEAFLPKHYINPSYGAEFLTNQDIWIIYCPLDYAGSGQITFKDRDRVDAFMIERVRLILEHVQDDITDMVIFTGDADFSRLPSFAKMRGKRVTVISAENAFSSRFIEMKLNDIIETHVLNPSS